MMLLEDAPYTLNDKIERSRRVEMLDMVHAKPLADFHNQMKADLGESYHIPHFDPCDGGISARALFLLEAPGPKAVISEFVSSNNPDPTARNFWYLIHDTRIPRSDTLLWNVVPWYVGDGKKIRPVTREDTQQALPYLRQLLRLLPLLQVIVLVGRKAQLVTSDIRVITTLPIMPAFHPSAQVFNISPDKKRLTQEVFAIVAQVLKNDP